MDPDRLRRLASARGGVFTSADVAAAGFSRRDAAYWLRRGAWTRLAPGSHVETALLEAADARERHRLEVAARLAVLRPGVAVASHVSASVVLGVDLVVPLPDEPVLTLPRPPGARSGVHGMRIAALPPQDVTVVRGIRTTTLPRTVVDVARDAGARQAVLAIGAAYRAGARREQLAAVLRTQRGWPGAARPAGALAIAQAGTETPLEDLSLWALDALGLPRPRVQVEIRTSRGDFLGRVDFLWLEQRVVGEADGRGKYDRPDALWSEKRREDRLRDAGFEVVRWSWRDAWNADPALGARVRAAFARSAGRAA